MNELSELLVSSTSDPVSLQPVKITEQIIDNTVVQSELEKRKLALEQLHSNIETFRQNMANSEEMNSIEGYIISSFL